MNSWLGRILLVILAFSPTASPADEPSKPADGDFTIGPTYTNAPELTVKDGVPRGVVTQFVMNSEDSKIYPGIAKRRTGVVPYKRKVWVYVPKQYVAGTAVPFIIAQDGGGYVKTLIPVLDTLIHEKRVPVMAAILIDSGGGDAQGSQRGLEYDTVSGVYAGFVETEVLPRAAKEAGVKFTTDPDGRATMGGSSGGSCRVHDGVVPSGPVPPRADLLRNLRKPAVAGEPAVAARGVGVPRESDPQERGQASAGVAGGE